MYSVNKFINWINFGYIKIYSVWYNSHDSFKFDYQIVNSYKNYSNYFQIERVSVKDIDCIIFIYFFSLIILINLYWHAILHFLFKCCENLIMECLRLAFCNYCSMN